MNQEQSSPADSAIGPIALIDSGPISGTREGDIVSFKGIPYAAPPVGALRWRAPQPVEPWTQVRITADFAADSMQTPYAQRPAASEDSLYLNVWAPAGGTGNKPVLVWIHGGGFVNGSPSRPYYSGAELASRDVVVVSFNYRLGRFGFFAHPQLTREQEQCEALGSYAVMDQIAALQWVQRNIAVFGGDPGNVTVMGESAGGTSVHMLLTSPHARTLMHKAVILSGGDGREQSDLNQAERAGVAFAQTHGIFEENPQAVEQLRQLGAQDIVGDLSLASRLDTSSLPQTYALPLKDGSVAVDILDAYRKGRYSRVPVIIGATSDDLFGPNGSMVVGAKTIADHLAKWGEETFHFRFTYVAQSIEAAHPRGATHSSEIPYFMGTLKHRYADQVTVRDLQASQIASGYLVNFLSTGNPNGEGLPTWPTYLTESPQLVDFDANGGIEVFED
ncbi:carboxylesterase family protein [Pseudomonas sp. NPDC008258]|uniref:carboxylesterase/lipase family protein n=1 Tax=Pseudomonas sp. NPDC008258 TaxID=3364418 RepID=UPI0036EE863C